MAAGWAPPHTGPTLSPGTGYTAIILTLQCVNNNPSWFNNWGVGGAEFIVWVGWGTERERERDRVLDKQTYIDQRIMRGHRKTSMMSSL
jgi:hypothetical protein